MKAERRLAIVVADFNESITHAMRDRAIARARALGYDPTPVLHVSGTYDLPFLVAKALDFPGVVGAIAIGCIITGETRHDDLIAHAAAKSLLDVALAKGKPVGLGVTGPGQTFDQAMDRLDRADAAVDAVHRTLASLEAGR